MSASLVGSEMCIRDSRGGTLDHDAALRLSPPPGGACSSERSSRQSPNLGARPRKAVESGADPGVREEPQGPAL
eukprot:5193926-Alexandrium_andersonii.AAC.1